MQKINFLLLLNCLVGIGIAQGAEYQDETIIHSQVLKLGTLAFRAGQEQSAADLRRLFDVTAKRLQAGELDKLPLQNIKMYQLWAKDLNAHQSTLDRFAEVIAQQEEHQREIALAQHHSLIDLFEEFQQENCDDYGEKCRFFHDQLKSFLGNINKKPLQPAVQAQLALYVGLATTSNATEELINRLKKAAGLQEPLDEEPLDEEPLDESKSTY
jgi:hypothetical protein